MKLHFCVLELQLLLRFRLACHLNDLIKAQCIELILQCVLLFRVLVSVHHVVERGALGSWLLFNAAISHLNLLSAGLMGPQPVLVQQGYHGLEDVLTRIKLRLFFVTTDSKTYLLFAERNCSLKASHFISNYLFRLAGRWLNLELHLGDLR